MDQDAHNAVVALILGRAGRYGRYVVEDRNNGIWAIGAYGVPFRVVDSELQWWATYLLDDHRKMNATLRRAAEHLLGIELADLANANFITIIGPLGLAALRAELNLKYPQQ